MQRAWKVVVDAAKAWFNDDALSLGASIAFYTIFSLAPIVILVTAVAGLVFGQEAARGALTDQLGSLIGRDAAQTVQDLVASAGKRQAGLWASILGVLTVLIGATTVFTQLQAALNRIWKVAPPDQPVTWMVKVRLKGLALVGAIGFLLIVSLVVSAALAALSTWVGQVLPGVTALLWTVDIVVSWAMFTLLFALIYRVLPDTRVSWRDLWVGSVITALLFMVGKLLIGLYLGTTGVASAYGAAGSFVLILLWVYYSAVIFLFGAEITRAYSERIGSRARPGSAPGRRQPPAESSSRATAVSR